MTTQPEPQRTTVPLSALKAPEANPRTSFDEAAIEGLAASILEDGLLQNLVVTPHGRSKKKPRYRIISGERRFRALALLKERGDIPAGHPIPVEIRGELDGSTALRLATVENVQRENLSPMDEAEAFARLAADGQDLAEIAAQTGCAPRTVERRLALNALCEEAKTALRENRIGLAEAQALTLGSAEAQRGILERLFERGWHYDAEDIRDALTADNPTVSMAIFPLDRYTGSLTTDLFADEETTYFDDAEEFLRLQEEAVEELAADHRKTAAWVEITHESVLRSWRYRRAEEGEPSGTVINLSPCGHVEVETGLVKPQPVQPARSETAEADIPVRKPAVSRPLCRLIGYAKSLAVQASLLEDPRTAKRLAVLNLLHPGDVHDALRHYLDSGDTPPPAYTALNAAAEPFLGRLSGRKKVSRSRAWLDLLTLDLTETERYEKLKDLPDEDLDQLLALLTALRIGQQDCERLDTDADSLFNHVAADLGVEMRDHWTPDALFLERQTREQLAGIARESGAGLTCTKKGELVRALARHFAEARNAAKPSDRQQQANAWLPGVMRFPAIDPAAPESEAEAAPETTRAAA